MPLWPEGVGTTYSGEALQKGALLSTETTQVGMSRNRCIAVIHVDFLPLYFTSVLFCV